MLFRSRPVPELVKKFPSVPMTPRERRGRAQERIEDFWEKSKPVIEDAPDPAREGVRRFFRQKADSTDWDKPVLSDELPWLDINSKPPGQSSHVFVGDDGKRYQLFYKQSPSGEVTWASSVYEYTPWGPVYPNSLVHAAKVEHAKWSAGAQKWLTETPPDRKSTRLNSSH